MKPNNKLISTMALAVLAAAASLSWTTTASASSPVTVTNPGFEDPAIPTDGSLGPLPTGWSSLNGSGGSIVGLNPSSSADLSAEAPQGSNVGLVFGTTGDGGFAQVLTSQLQADATYSLSVKVANTKFTTGFPGYRVQLLAGGTVLAEDDNSLAPGEDAVVTSTVPYAYNVADAALVGQALEVRLLSKGGSNEVAFDDVQLSVTLTNPAADPGGPYLVAIPGGSLSLDGSGSLPSEGQTITTWEWDLDNDGIYDVTGATPATIDYATLTGASPGGYGMVAGDNTIKLRVTDNSSPTPKTSISPATVTLAEPSTTLSTGNWQGGAWSNGQPDGSGLDAIIAGNAAANGAVTSWSGDLTVNSGVTLTVTGTTADFIAVAGAANIRLTGTIVNNWKTRTLASNFIVSGGGALFSNNNAANNQDQQFSGVISGTGGFSVSGRNHQGLTFTNVNTFTGGFTAQSQNQRYGIGFGTGSAGAGDVTILGTAGSQSAVIRVLGNDPFATTATLSLNGSGWNSTTGGFGPYVFYSGTSYNIDMNGKTATVDKLFVNGVQQAAGTYVGGGATWIGDRVGGGSLTVTTGPVDNTPPTLTGSGFVDDKSGGPITAFETVNYTVTFSEPMKSSTVTADDFENSVSPAATINSVTPTIDPAVYTVSVTPGGTGTLQLQVKAGAMLEDMAGNLVVTTTAIPDDTVITVSPDPLPSLVSIIDSTAGGPVVQNQLVTYFVTFDQVMDPATVDFTDFENGAGPAVTVSNVISTGDPSVFAVDVTPGGTGTITLQIKAGAILRNANGTALNTTAALPDDTTITVNAGSVSARGMITVDGVESWNATSGTLTGTLNASGSDKLVVIVTGENGNPGDLNGNSSSVTYDGVPLTKVVDRNPIGGTPFDQTFNDIWYLDNPATSTGEIVASVNNRGSVTAFALSGTDPGVGQTAISPQASKSVVIPTSFANSIVIASHGMGGDGNTANVESVDALPPLTETSARYNGSHWDGQVTAYALVPSAGTASYSFTGGNLVGSHTIAAEFIAAVSGGGTPYETWAGGAAFDADANGDGVKNGLAFLLGATGPNVSALGLLPTVTESGGGLVLSFNARNAASRGSAVLYVEHSSDLGISDPWIGAAVPETNGGPVNGVTFAVTPGSPNAVVATISSSEAAGGKLFARLRAENP